MELKTPTVKFLLVDDREANLIALEALLRRDGLELLKARTADEALELLLVHDVALALLDVEMPDMDGFRLAELMRGTDRSRHVPIIFVTANPVEHHRIFQGYYAGAVDFLVKPIDPRILRHKTETFYQLEKQRQQLAETLRMTEMFVAAVGHDLRSPIHAVLTGVNLILESTGEPPTRKAAEHLHASCQRMARMVDDLADLARVRLADGIALERQACDAGALVRRVVAELKVPNPSRTISIDARGDVQASWDTGRIERVVSNLVGNALLHGDEGTPVAVTVAGEGDDIDIAVHSGGHIAPWLLPTLFDAFRAGREQRVRRRGLGLGLYIVQQIVMAHRGRVSVETSEERGTTFTVRLPRAPG
jgi:two-component system, sensor histidine kinase and response regulator